MVFVCTSPLPSLWQVLFASPYVFRASPFFCTLYVLTMVDGHACSGCTFPGSAMGWLESLSRAVPQWECGGWAILNDLLTNYILFSGSTFREGLQWPGHGSRVIYFCVLECTAVTLLAWSPSFQLGQRRVFALGSGVHGAVLCVRLFVCDLEL